MALKPTPARRPIIPLPASADTGIRRAFDTVANLLAASTGETQTIVHRVMISMGLAQETKGGTVVAVDGVVPNMKVPPVPTGFVTSSGFGSITLRCDTYYPFYLNHGIMEVWRSLVNDRSTAIAVNGAPGFVVTDVPEEATPGTVFYYWIRFISSAGVVGPLNAEAGTAGQTTVDAGYVLEILKEKLGYGEFAPGVYPVRVVASLPALPDDLYPQGVAVFLASDNQLYRSTGTEWVGSVAAADITGQLTDDQLAAISAAKIAGQLTDDQLAAISAAKIAGQIVSTQITDDAITTPKIAAGAVTASEIAANTITAAEIAANTITATELAAGSVTAGKIAAGTIVAADIAANTITAAEIAAGAVTASELAAGAVVAGKIAAGAIVAGDGVIGNAAIGTAHIVDATMTTAKIANLAVDSAKIADAAIATAKIGNLAVSTAKIADAAITNAKINNLAVDNAKIANAAITNAKIDNLAVDAAKIANAAITTAKIGDLQVSTLKIEDNAVTVPVSAYTEGGLTINGTDYVVVQSASIDSLGQPVQVIFTMLATAWNDVGPVYDVAIFRDTTPILSANGISGYDIKTIALAMQDTPTSGTRTYSVQVRSGGTPTTIYPSNRSLLLLGVKK
jgi:hypothetical protein